MADSDFTLCKCGCGKPTIPCSRTDTARGWIRGEPRQYLPFHRVHYMSETQTYKSWKNMIRRCTTTSTSNCKDYYGRNITVCRRWRKFRSFLADMGERPPCTSLDRYPDNDGNYEPGNCRWATKLQQENNKSTNVFVEFEGKRLTISQWSRITGIATRTLHNRYKRAGDQPPRLFRPVNRRE